MTEHRRYIMQRSPLPADTTDSGSRRAWLPWAWPCAGAGWPEPKDVHLNVGSRELSGSPWQASGDVFRLEGAVPFDSAMESVGQALSALPGCLVAATRVSTGGCVAGNRYGTRIAVLPEAQSRRTYTGAEFEGITSFLHSQLVLGVSWQTLKAVTLTVPRSTGLGKMARAPLHALVVPLEDLERHRRLAA